MEERRTMVRRRVYKAGKIALHNAASIAGVVKNISDTGAMIEIPSLVSIPNEFTLVIESEQLTRPCQVVWREPTRMGVRFLAA